MDNIPKDNNTALYIQSLETNSQYIFRIATRGVLNYAIQLIATFLNVTTVIAVQKYKNLQIVSNAVIVSFSIGNSLAVINGSLSIATDFIMERDTTPWRIVYTALGFFLLLPHCINIIPIMAISIERVYCIYFAHHAYANNSFNKMTKIKMFIIIISIVKTALVIGLGFVVGNF